MKWRLSKVFLVIFLSFTSFAAKAAICSKDYQITIKMTEDWYKKEELRKQKEELLLSQYSSNIIKESKELVAEKFVCAKGEKCDPLKNCQMVKDVKNLRDEEYSIVANSGVIIAKSYCSEIGKCIGYNDFAHSLEVTASEDRLVDVKKNNAVFYHYFYSAHSKNYEHLFNLTNFDNGSELYFEDVPHFSLDDNFILELRSSKDFSINIYELSKDNEYKAVAAEGLDLQACGPTPYFHSWKNANEARLSQTPPSEANSGKMVLLFFDRELKKWRCKDEILPQPQCEYYLPNSIDFVSNILPQQIKNCRQSF